MMTTSGVFSAVGGKISYADGYKIHTFDEAGLDEFEVLTGTNNVEYLIVGGGGAGGGTHSLGAGGSGGGGGGAAYTGHATVLVNKYPVYIGEGGTSTNLLSTNGEDSSFDGIIARGGGYGGYYNGVDSYRGGDGGNGGGNNSSADFSDSYAGIGDQYDGGLGAAASSNNSSQRAGGGGGGAAQDGVDASLNVGGLGGNGLLSSISGWEVEYSNGGDGGGANTGNRVGPAATTYGGGGGGARSYPAANRAGGQGGQGIVIIRYPIVDKIIIPLDYELSFIASNLDVDDNIIYDEAGNWNGSFSNPASIATRLGPDGVTQAFEFNGSNQRINTSFRTNGGDYTISAWVYRDTGSGQSCIYSETAQTDNSRGAFFNFSGTGAGDELVGGHYKASAGNFDSTRFAPPPVIGEWHHVAFVRKDDDFHKVFVNGTLRAIEPCTSVTQNSTYNGQVGASANSTTSRWFDGAMDRFKIYKRALTDFEVYCLSREIYL